MTKKKVLFCISNEFPDNGACSNVLKSLLCKTNFRNWYDCFVLCPKKQKKNFTENKLDNVTIYSFNKDKHSLFFKISRFVSRIMHGDVFYDQKIEQLFRYYLSKIKTKNFDLIIAVQGGKFYETISSLRFSLKYSIPFALYQLDPCYSNKAVNQQYVLQRKRFEKELYSHSLFVLTTPLIYNEHLSDPDFLIYCDKIYTVELPLIIPNIVSFGRSVSKVKKCLFTGSLDKQIRNPDYAISLFKPLVEKQIISLDFVGNASGLLDTYNNSSIIFHGMTSIFHAQKLMQESDVLINIGNSVNNQLPSKIFDYISTGKPIINIVQCDSCPTIPYLTKYPLCLNIFKSDDYFTNVSKIENFIFSLDKTNISITENELNIIFEECTPDFVANKFKKIINAFLE